MLSMLDELIIQQNSDGLEEVVIGMVGAIGSNIAILQNILKTELEDTFNFDVFIIKVSEDILTPYINTKNLQNFDVSTKYKRIDFLHKLKNDQLSY